MSITYSGIEWDYDNLSGIAYSSDTLLEPYARWFYLITNAVNEEKELLGVGDGTKSNPAKTSKENIIRINEYFKRQVVYGLTDSFSITDNSKRKIKKISGENIILSDESKRIFNKKIKEDIVYYLDECRYIKTDTTQGTSVTVDQVELSGSVRLFDFEINNSTWNEDDFDSWCENNCPVNYNELRPFIPGEYEYTDAYAGFILKIPDFNGVYGVANSTVYIDVEDTVEKGTATTEGGSLQRVEFSKRFYTSPQIMTSLLYTTENCYIEVPTVTKEYFEFGLKSIVTGNYVAGEINWLADGY